MVDAGNCEGWRTVWATFCVVAVVIRERDYLTLGGEKVAGDLVSVKLGCLRWEYYDKVKRRPRDERTPLMPVVISIKLFVDLNNVTLQDPDLMASAVLHLVVSGDLTLEFHLSNLD